MYVNERGFESRCRNESNTLQLNERELEALLRLKTVQSTTPYNDVAITAIITAQENLPAYSIVTFSGYIAKNTSPSNFNRIAGMNAQEIRIGEQGTVILVGTVNNPTWNWDINHSSLYIGANGLSPTPSPPYLLPAARILDSKSLLLNLISFYSQEYIDRFVITNTSLYSYTLTFVPILSTTKVYFDGVLLSINNDYTIVNSDIVINPSRVLYTNRKLEIHYNPLF
jgi:hypothetical protein